MVFAIVTDPVERVIWLAARKAGAAALDACGRKIVGWRSVTGEA
jgi:hypothetical protein